MTFDEPLEDSIRLLNDALTDLGKKGVFENSDFLVGELSTKFFLDLNVSPVGRNTIPMSIQISAAGGYIGLDQKSEVYEWSSDFAKKSASDVRKLITCLLSSFIMVEYCGSNYTCFNVFNQGGELLFSRPVIDGIFFLKHNCKKKLYSPIYPNASPTNQ